MVDSGGNQLWMEATNSSFTRFASRRMDTGVSGAEHTCFTLFEMLPHVVVEDIINRLENAKYISTARCVCKDFNEAGKWVRTLRCVCLDEYHVSARACTSLGSPQPWTVGTTSKRGEGEPSSSTKTSTTQAKRITEHGGNKDQESSTLPVTVQESRTVEDGESKRQENESTVLTQVLPISEDAGVKVGDTTVLGSEKKEAIIFKDLVVRITKDLKALVQLRIEIEPKLQSKVVPEEERKLIDHWLSEPLHLRKWIPHVSATLQHLCIVDYGQQAIMRRTTILQILSEECKGLKTLDLRNMFIDTTGCEDMLMMTSFTMRCVKANGNALQHINDHMPNLQTLALLGVFGITEANLTFMHMKVLCLGLSTAAKVVTVNMLNLVKLQLKMLCPEKLIVMAPILKFIAFNLEVRESSNVELKNIHSLQELLYGASSFFTLSRLISLNPNLDKIFLDIPCMALGEDGKWLGVLKDIQLNLPSFNKLQECSKLGVLNVGPGLWYSMEVNLGMLTTVEKWPPLKRLILHMIPQKLETCLAILSMLVKPSLTSLEIYVHTNSPVDLDEIVLEVEGLIMDFGPNFTFTPRAWTKSLDFSCFSF